jgi:hypothetical protein
MATPFRLDVKLTVLVDEIRTAPIGRVASFALVVGSR